MKMMKNVNANKYFVIVLDYKDALEEELLISKFLNFNPLGFKSFENKLWIYFSYDSGLLNEILSFLKKEKLRYSLSIFPAQNWNQNWKKFFKITKVCEGLYVLPPWKKTKRLGLKIYINPALAFGTGTHESTQIAMYFIYKYLYPNTSFLDVGTGSGILSILAKKVGSTDIVACDIDPAIKENFYENLALNGIKKEEIKLFLKPMDFIKKKFDFVVCNIEYQHMYPLLEKLIEKTEKYLILSGLMKGELKLVVEKLSKYSKFKILEEKQKGNWEGIIIRKK